MLKINEKYDSSLKLKGRIEVHRNLDAYIDLVRIDSTAADMMFVRMVISIAAWMGLNMPTADIKGSYMQSGPIPIE